MYTKIQLKVENNNNGSLAWLEANKNIPFDIKRIYYLFGLDLNGRRGFHAHKKLQQFLICVHGHCNILLDDGKSKEVVHLNSPNEGLLIQSTVWREIYDFSEGAVLFVLASEYYDESDYIRNYDEFLDYLKN